MVYTVGFTIREADCKIFCGRGEMVYTLVLGTSALTGVEVQVLSPAQINKVRTPNALTTIIRTEILKIWKKIKI